MTLGFTQLTLSYFGSGLGYLYLLKTESLDNAILAF